MLLLPVILASAFNSSAISAAPVLISEGLRARTPVVRKIEVHRPKAPVVRRVEVRRPKTSVVRRVEVNRPKAIKPVVAEK